MKILAFDTSTEACSVALAVEDTVRARVVHGQQHSTQILSMVDELLGEAGLRLNQLDALAFGRGPGLFTGLRIGAGVVQGLAFGADLAVVPVSSLAALAQGQEADRVLAALDARMSQVYWGAYTRGVDGIVELTGAECVTAPEDVPVPTSGNWLGVGSGWDRYADALALRVGTRLTGWASNCYPQARDVARLGRVGLARDQAVTPERALPVYIRDEVARKQGP
ncbi:MAG: tRNA (adenosine(37)-N6)-threonylcarbamoyltransferase complex dimerization subunit type 1 TsaB [Acidiferrobacterales bacterium]